MTLDRLSALATELQLPAYVGLSDLAAANLMNDPAHVGVVSVRAVDVKRVLILAGKWPAIVIASRASNPAAVNITEALATFDTFDMADPTYLGAITAGLQALVDAALISAEDKAACLALGTGPIARSAELGFGTVTPSDVADARRLA